MPLSEEEQKILRQIEDQLSASDPALVEQVSRTTLYRHSARVIRWAALGFVAGLVLLLLTYQTEIIAATLGFAAMLGSLFVIERHIRKMGKAGLERMTGGWRQGGNLRNTLSERGRAWRERFRRDDRG